MDFVISGLNVKIILTKLIISRFEKNKLFNTRLFISINYTIVLHVLNKLDIYLLQTGNYSVNILFESL